MNMMEWGDIGIKEPEDIVRILDSGGTYADLEDLCATYGTRVAGLVREGKQTHMLLSMQKKLTSEQAARISRDPAVMFGEPVFVGTRVPVKTVAKMYLMAGGRRALNELQKTFPYLSTDDFEIGRVLATWGDNT